jgi:hypothetical protein
VALVTDRKWRPIASRGFNSCLDKRVLGRCCSSWPACKGPVENAAEAAMAPTGEPQQGDSQDRATGTPHHEQERMLAEAEHCGGGLALIPVLLPDDRPVMRGLDQRADRVLAQQLPAVGACRCPRRFPSDPSRALSPAMRAGHRALTSQASAFPSSGDCGLVVIAASPSRQYLERRKRVREVLIPGFQPADM